MNRSDKKILLAAILWAVILSLILVWWLPQKWAICGKLYNNLPAKIICFSSR
jgi:hypothetical protein